MEKRENANDSPNGKHAQHVSRSGEKGGPSAQQMVESRMLYVGTEERMLLYEMFLHYMKSHTQYPPPVLPKEHTDLAF